MSIKQRRSSGSGEFGGFPDTGELEIKAPPEEFSYNSGTEGAEDRRHGLFPAKAFCFTALIALLILFIYNTERGSEEPYEKGSVLEETVEETVEMPSAEEPMSGSAPAETETAPPETSPSIPGTEYIKESGEAETETVSEEETSNEEESTRPQPATQAPSGQSTGPQPVTEAPSGQDGSQEGTLPQESTYESTDGQSPGESMEAIYGGDNWYWNEEEYDYGNEYEGQDTEESQSSDPAYGGETGLVDIELPAPNRPILSTRGSG